MKKKKTVKVDVNVLDFYSSAPPVSSSKNIPWD